MAPNVRPTSLGVLVPTWNERRALPRLLASLAAAGGADEVVVADGGSTDGTVELARSAGVRVVQGPRGRGTQLATAARASSAELLVVLHADAELAPGALDAVRTAFEDPALVAAGMRQRVEHEGRVYRSIERAADRRVRRGWIYGDSGLCVRREAYERVGGFRDVPLFEDLELSRALRREGRVALVEGAELRLSPRRWERRGVVRQTLENRLLTLAWRLGVPAARLARFYAPEPRRDGDGPRVGDPSA